MTREEAIKTIMSTTVWTDEEREALGILIPELKESEDEKIRKEIIDIVKAYRANCVYEGTHKFDDCLAWLEKQKEQNPAEVVDESTKRLNDNWMKQHFDDYKEQKPAEWSEVEFEFRGEKVKVKRPFFRDDKGRGYSTTEQDDDVAWYALRAWCEKKGVSLYDLYPRTEWSEEDEKDVAHIIQVLDDCYAYGKHDLSKTDHENLVGTLKSLRPQSHWKPNEEQMEALLWCVAHLGGSDRRVLAELYEHLKKL